MDRDLLAQIVAATKADSYVYTSVTAHQPMLAQGLVEVNGGMADPADPTKFATRATAAADTFLAAPVTQSGAVTGGASKYAIITNAKLPDAKRRGNPGTGGAATKYPFADMEVGASFFSPNSDHKKNDAVKGLGSTVSAQNDKYSEPVMENGAVKTKTVTRAIRDKTTKKAQIGADGRKVTETVELPVKNYTRKFSIRPVEAGKTYGNWTAPADGALIARIK